MIVYFYENIEHEILTLPKDNFVEKREMNSHHGTPVRRST